MDRGGQKKMTVRTKQGAKVPKYDDPGEEKVGRLGSPGPQPGDPGCNLQRRGAAPQKQAMPSRRLR